MKTWIALLRGINVGGKHLVPMKELVKLMEANAFSNVRTYIQSGNVICQYSTKPKDEIGRLIEKKYGFKPEVLVLSGTDLRKAVDNNPYKSGEGRTVHFFFCDKVPKSIDYEFLDSLKVKSEKYQLIGRVFYLHAPNGIACSKLVEKMGRAFTGVTMTARNLNTVNMLAEMFPPPGPQGRDGRVLA
jgi:uncharacterized protein (DUF1697 family)